MDIRACSKNSPTIICNRIDLWYTISASALKEWSQMTENDKSSKAPTVAYVPFKTFLSAIEMLEQGVPDNINRTVWSSFSGVTVGQVLGAFRFLGLINQDGTPTEGLHLVVDDAKNRKEQLRRIMTQSYTKLAKRDLEKMDLKSLQDIMREYEVTGATLQKAITFFLQLARYAEVPLSPYLLKQTRNVSGPRKRRTITPRNGQMEELEETQSIIQNQSGSSKTINLNRGINLTLRTSADVFKMSPEDRGFVLKLLDQIEDYEAQVKAQPEKVDF
jgi:hypothetical protein